MVESLVYCAVCLIQGAVFAAAVIWLLPLIIAVNIRSVRRHLREYEEIDTSDD